MTAKNKAEPKILKDSYEEKASLADSDVSERATKWT